MLAQDALTITPVHGYVNLYQVTKTTKVSVAPNHNALSGSVIVKPGISGWLSPLGFPPEKYLRITLSNGHPEFVIDYDLVQWPVIAHCTIVNNLEQRTHVLAPVPLTVLRSNSKFDQNLECSNLWYVQPITKKFCTRHDSYTVVTCAKFRCDRKSTF